MEQLASGVDHHLPETCGAARDTMTERCFLDHLRLALAAGAGRVWAGRASRSHRAASTRDLLREANEAQLRARLRARFEVGGLPEAMIRALIYVRLPERSADERGFAVIKIDPRDSATRPAPEPAAA